MQVLVYRYGLLPPTDPKLVHELMRTAHRYKNTLVEIERGKRSALRQIEAEAGLLDAVVAFRAADAEVEAAMAAVRTFKIETRSAKVPAELRAEVDAAKERRRAASAAVREVRRTLRESEEIATKKKEIEALGLELSKNARAHSGMASLGPFYGAFGTYLLIENAVQKAAQTPLYDGLSWEPQDPRFSRFNGDGSVGVQISGGVRVDELLTSNRVQIVPRAHVGSTSARRNPANVGKVKQDSRRASMKKTLRLRIATTGARSKDVVWAEWPMIMSRPLPKDAQIMNVAVHVKTTAFRPEWYVTFTIRTSEGRAPADRLGAVAVNFGWRKIEDEVRVATWVAENGERGEVRVPSSTLERLRHAASIRSLRDELFNVGRAWFVEVLAATPNKPDWLLERTKSIALWRSSLRVHSLSQHWKNHRFEGDDAAYEALDAFRRRDRHLWQYEAGERRNALGHRLDVYRNVAARLSARFDTFVHDDVDFTTFKTCPMVDEERGNPVARSNMHAAAPGELRSALSNAFRGDEVVVPAFHVTHTCPVCKRVEAFDAAIKISHRCGGCGELWDQDYAAAENLLSRRHEGKVVDNSTPTESRFVRAKKAAATGAQAP